MRIDSRLSRLMPALTARERAILALRANRLGQDPGEARGAMPPEQRREYNRYLALVFVAGCQMGALVHVLKNQVDSLEFDLDRIAMLEQAAAMLEQEYPDELPAATVKPWRTESKTAGKVTVPRFLRALAAELRHDAFKELSVRWRELRAVETVLSEIGEQFDGEDALHPDARAWLTACRAQALAFAVRLGRKRLPEPGEDYLARAQALVDQGFAALGLVEE